jgi:hypothetical protein
MDEPGATDRALSLKSPAHSTIGVDAGSWHTADATTQTDQVSAKPEDDFVALFATESYRSLDISRPLLKEVNEL